MSFRISVLVVVLLVSGAVPAGVAGGVDASAATGPDLGGGEPSVTTDVHGDSSATMADADEILHRTTELRHLPDRPGEFEAEMTFEVPESVSRLEITLESEADVRSVEGFEANGDGTYRWTEGTDEPTVRFTMPADRTGPVGYQHDGDGYTFVDTGDWGVVQVPGVGLSYRTPGSVTLGIEETVSVAGPGAAGTDVAFFGRVTEHERTVDGETIRLVVPDAADLRERPDDILESLATASGQLEVGSSDTEVFVVAVPTDVDWGPRGVQYGQSDAWVVADAPLEEASNVWLHEYVHVRQGFANPNVGTTTEVEWLVEAQADYYAGLLAYEQGLIRFSEFSQHLERGERSPYADGTLADPRSWEDERTDYVKGALVAGELDRRLRLASDGDRTLADVFRQLNAQHERVSETDLLTALEEAGGEAVRDAAERYTRTPETPDAWNRFEHGAAFELSRATIAYELGSAPIEVADRPWERWDRDELDGVGAGSTAGDTRTDRGVMAVPAGETVAVPVAIDNVDDRAGTADATLQVDGGIVDYERLRLEAGDGATETLSWTPTEPGVYDVSIGSDRLTVFVRSTSSLTVTELRVEPDGVDPGESVTATATVTNDGTYPAAGRLEFRTAAETAAGPPIALAPGEDGTVEARLAFDDEGRYELTAGGQSVTVTVGGLLGTVESMPGFGVGIVAAGLVLATVVLGRRRWREPPGR
ncbi:M61 metallopeptidase family protein [Natronorubrum halophilum]|uniref:hypothetical protein n=1 Tax=Natronorubrum halophilum TaxID=1702106 RepID=UPI000EF698EB|nr:hypothetical protein [Natronorubrum halophilum]